MFICLKLQPLLYAIVVTSKAACKNDGIKCLFSATPGWPHETQSKPRFCHTASFERPRCRTLHQRSEFAMTDLWNNGIQVFSLSSHDAQETKSRLVQQHRPPNQTLKRTVSRFASLGGRVEIRRYYVTSCFRVQITWKLHASHLKL